MKIEAATYDVRIEPGFGGLDGALAEVGPRGRCVVVTNPVVGALYARTVLEILRAGGWEASLLEVPDGEANKGLAAWQALVEALLSARVDRRTPVLALGGGVTGDLVGFAAASTLRGLPLVQLPTTLLAMVDSSVGGKTGVNTVHGKNLVGAFHQPCLVWAATNTLQTLPAAEVRCGLGEVLKHVVIEGEEALAECEREATALAARDPRVTERFVARSVETKARIVSADPLESGQRAILNLGHTLGHAVEAVAGYGTVRHGEAVAIGLCAVARYTASRGWLDAPGLPGRITALASALGLPIVPPPGLDSEAVARAVGFDKKRLRAKIRLVVPRAPGQVVLHDLPIDEVPGLVRALFSEP